MLRINPSAAYSSSFTFPSLFFPFKLGMFPSSSQWVALGTRRDQVGWKPSEGEHCYQTRQAFKFETIQWLPVSPSLNPVFL